MATKTRKVGQVFSEVPGSGRESDELHVWYSEEEKGWVNCFSGVRNGLYSESDNSSPFDTESEAWEDVKIRYEEWHTN